MTAYRAEAGAGDAGMAVLVQDLVAADAAGVAFTANPVTGDAETLVSAVRGVGERLVGGEATPDEWVVRGGEAVSVAEPERAIDAEQAARVADLARRVEETLGGPQDIEWALAAGSLFLLQARPITALPQPPRLEPRRRLLAEGRHALPAAAHAVRRVGVPSRATPGVRAGDRAVRAPLRGRRAAIARRRAVHAHDPGRRQGPKAAAVVGRVARVAPGPTLRRRERIAREALRTDAARRLVARWNDEWSDEFRRAAATYEALVTSRRSTTRSCWDTWTPSSSS